MKTLILLISFLIIGCSNIVSRGAQEKEKIYYPNGNLKSEISFINNIKNGPIFNYFEDGRIAVKGYFKNDQREKKWYFYDENTGKLIAIENYKNGLLEGEQIYYYPDGNLKVKGNYKDNYRVGFWQMYDENGKLSVQNIFLDGEDVVSVALFQENGNIFCSGLTKNGLRDGIWQYYDTEGKLLYDVEYLNGIRDGEWKAYDKDGNIIATGYYNHGKILGLE